MKLNTDRLNAFYQAALDKSFCQAADTLCITQSALSQRVLKLEQELGTNLLIRSPEGIGLTEQGKALFDYVSDLQAREQDVLNKVTGRSAIANGIIRVGAFSLLWRGRGRARPSSFWRRPLPEGRRPRPAWPPG